MDRAPEEPSTENTGSVPETSKAPDTPAEAVPQREPIQEDSERSNEPVEGGEHAEHQAPATDSGEAAPVPRFLPRGKMTKPTIVKK